MTEKERAALERAIAVMRRDILELCHRAGGVGAHLGGCLSLVELLAVLYTRHLRFDKNNPLDENRDRFVLSKGHGGIAQYAAMHAAGILTDGQIAQPLLGEDTILFKHPRRNAEKGIEFSGGSLGQGLPFAVGEAIALNMRGNAVSRVYALVGDGELNEGSMWEALSIAGHRKLNTLTVIVDRNGLQLDGFTKDIQSAENLAERFAAFGFDALEIDGHDPEAIDAALSARPTKPFAILARTVKGRGVSFAENNADWHANVLTGELYERAGRELGVDA